MSDEMVDRVGKRYLRFRIRLLTGLRFGEYVANKDAIDASLNPRVVLRARRLPPVDAEEQCAA